MKSSLIDFLSRADAAEGAPPAPVTLRAKEGTYEGLRYQIQGEGPPLLLLPLSLSPSQWAPLIEEVKDRFCMIVLGGEFPGVSQ